VGKKYSNLIEKEASLMLKLNLNNLPVFSIEIVKSAYITFLQWADQPVYFKDNIADYHLSKILDIPSLTTFIEAMN